jgi:glycine/D-amino acid oxidase-like deaminating enzyme
MPQVGVVDGLLYATGCNGSGVALNTWLGTRLAAMAEGADPPPFAELGHRAIPLWGLRRAYLPAVGSWFRWRDRHP